MAVGPSATGVQPPNGTGVLLTASTVGTHLVARGILAPGTELLVDELAGGVSNVVLGVRAGDRHVVVKQALPRLRVADEWLAKRERALTEAAAMELVAPATPGSVPPVLDVDEDACAITIGHAPEGWATWKGELLAGEVDPGVGARLGTLLGTWHRVDVSGTPVLDDPEAFEQLRVDPYYRTVARRTPDLAPAIHALIDRMTDARCCLVHGDFSPKNVLVGSDGLWVIDFEVAHLGDPAFDVAFLTNHLVLKAVHRPGARDGYVDCAARFWEAYREAVPAGFLGEPTHALQHLGALLVARVDGKSPAEYLTPGEGAVVRALGRSLLTDPAHSLDEVWDRLTEVQG